MGGRRAAIFLRMGTLLAHLFVRFLQLPAPNPSNLNLFPGYSSRPRTTENNRKQELSMLSKNLGDFWRILCGSARMCENVRGGARKFKNVRDIAAQPKGFKIYKLIILRGVAEAA